MNISASATDWATITGLTGLGTAAAAVAFSRLGHRSEEERLQLPRCGLDAGRLLEAALKEKGEETVLGAIPGRGLLSRRRPFTLLPGHRQRHMQIMGPTRCGKSQLLFALCAQDMARDMPVFLMEAKGDVGDFAQFAKLAVRTGRVQDVRYFNPADSRSMTLNPIQPVPGQDAVSIANQVSPR